MMVSAAWPGIARKVVLTMREESAVEIFGNSFIADRAELADRLVAALPAMMGAHILGDEAGEPAVLVGVIPMAPGRGSMIFLANDRFPAITIAAHRWWHTHFVPSVLMQWRRVEFTGAADPRSAKWLRGLGFIREGIAHAYGKAGEDFGHWAWLHPDVRALVDATVLPLVSPATRKQA